MVCVRFMYFPVRNSGRGRIDRCSMDATNCVTLISVNTSWPSGLAIDVDGKFYLIQSSLAELHKLSPTSSMCMVKIC